MDHITLVCFIVGNLLDLTDPKMPYINIHLILTHACVVYAGPLFINI